MGNDRGSRRNISIILISSDNPKKRRNSFLSFKANQSKQLIPYNKTLLKI